MQEAHLIASLEQRLEEILARLGRWLPGQSTPAKAGTPRSSSRAKRVLNPSRVLANGVAGIRGCLFLARQHIVQDSNPISMPTTWVARSAWGIGEDVSDIILALSSQQHSLGFSLRHANGGTPPTQDQRKLISDRQSSQHEPEAATSPIVAPNPDGRGAVCRRRSLSARQPRPHVVAMALPLLPPGEQRSSS
jgi:hypothetical protein